MTQRVKHLVGCVAKPVSSGSYAINGVVEQRLNNVIGQSRE